MTANCSSDEELVKASCAEFWLCFDALPSSIKDALRNASTNYSSVSAYQLYKAMGEQECIAAIEFSDRVLEVKYKAAMRTGVIKRMA